jgi:endogenous inhibitor of DNA gyrase (YacG/DUF329 family)
MIGKRFGELLVVKRIGSKLNYGNFRIFWLCECSCGKYIEKCGKLLRNGTVKSCGCLRSKTGSLAMKRMTERRKELSQQCPVGRGVGTGICETCGQIIKKHGRLKRRFCSRNCYAEKHSDKVTVTCERCGKIVQKTKKCAAKYKRHFCSKECSVLMRQDGLSLFRNFVRGACRHLEKRKLHLDVTPEDLKIIWEKQEGICPYTGWKLKLKSDRGDRRNLLNASLDRIDSSMGYTKENVQFVSIMANYAKNDFSDDQLFEFCRAVTFNKHKNLGTSSCFQLPRSKSFQDFSNHWMPDNILQSKFTY